MYLSLRDPRVEEYVCDAVDAAECMLLIELLYFDSIKICREPDPSSMFEVELRVCGVRPARPIP